MTHNVTWNQLCNVLHLKMSNTLSLEEFIEIDTKINAQLQECGERIALVVDASNAHVSPYGIDRIKLTQTYLKSYQISQLIVVGDKKITRLVMLLLFNLCRPRLQFCDNLEQAQRVINVAAI